MNTYTYNFTIVCPNNEMVIRYALTIKAHQTIMVEKIIRAVKKLPYRGYHEDVADQLARLLPGVHTLRAHHHGVGIETVRGEA
jgi:hypothetical protein